MSLQGDKIAQVARAHRGEHETPMGSNRGKLPDACFHFVHGAGADPAKVSATDREWCAEFACYVAHEAGVAEGPKTASTGGLYDWANDRGLVLYDPYDDDPGSPHDAQPGDFGLVIDARTPTGYRHTVILDHAIGEGRLWETTEGNFGNRVARNERDIHTLTVVRPYGEG